MPIETAGLIPGARRIVWLSDEDPALFRYRLDVELGEAGPPLAFLGHNPSRASHLVDDPSLVRMVGFGRRERASRVTILNPAAYRTAKPAELRARFAAGLDIFGPDNRAVVEQTLSWLSGQRGRLVLAYGAIAGPLPFREAMEAAIAEILGEARRCLDIEVVSLGLTRGGAPRHPLYLRTTAPMSPWTELGA